ncbi:hypothetical protein [Burkholderia sp. Cy-637]|uniref:hypothetical protein n=1 Tax=Burkholderia sp. Cy-637 TaxID=2608327 RepID=UPI00141D7989|nr:hypothetical protein [Burkholderia sp. Cy-637]NIF88872.1 hypothetical protein [Burkholderia sp. Cy-637]
MIFIKDAATIAEQTVSLKSEDITPEFLIHVCGHEPFETYVGLRAFGYGTIEAFAATLSDFIVGHPDSIADALAEMEKCDSFKEQFDYEIEGADSEVIRAAWNSRAKELSTFASDAAMVIRLKARSEEQSRSQGPRESRFPGFDRIIQERYKEHEEQESRDRMSSNSVATGRL